MRGYSAIGLFHPKTPENVGSVLRACHNFEVSLLSIEGKRFRKASTDTYKSYRHLPVLEVENLKDTIPYNCIPVAVELVPQAVSIVDYKHPQ